MKPIKKVLVPTDFSGYSLSAMDYALSLAAVYEAKVYLLNVVDNIPTGAFHTIDLDAEAVRRNAQERAVDELKKFVSQKLEGREDLVQVVRCGNPAEEIAAFAKDEHVDLIVMATHGRTGLAHMLMGSVAERVVRESNVPVLTVKPEQFQWNPLKESDVREQLHLKF